MHKSKYEEALKLFHLQLTEELSSGMKDIARARIAIALARTGSVKKSREMLGYLTNRSNDQYVPFAYIALIHLALDEIDQAFAWLEKAYQERSDDLPHLLKTSSFLDKIRPDLRFKDLLRRMKLDQ